jgi:hypothetical protein
MKRVMHAISTTTDVIVNLDEGEYLQITQFLPNEYHCYWWRKGTLLGYGEGRIPHEAVDECYESERN